MVSLQEIEARRLTEQQRLDLLKDRNERNRRGQFATPSALAVDIAEYAWRRWKRRAEPVRFLDPALGTGSFYSALRRVFPSGLIASAAGVELDPDIAAAASSLWKRTGLKTTTGDFTTQSPGRSGGCCNLILTNPPYVRHHHLSPTEKVRLKAQVAQELGLRISGLAGLYCYFVVLCDRWLADGGLAVWLLPSEFMNVNYGTALRRYLTENVKLLQIHRFCPSDVQFSDALVSSAVVVYEKSAPPPSHSVLCSFGGHLSRPDRKERVGLTELRHAHKWTKYPREKAERACDRDHPLTLGDIFTIKRGLATGANDFFILPRKDARRLGIPSECTRPILPGPRHLQEAIVEAMGDGYPKIEKPLSLIDCNYSEHEIRKMFPEFWSYLRTGKQRSIHRGYLASRRSPWYAQERRDPAPFLCTYMGRPSNGRKPFRFIWNKSDATAPNVYLLLYPKGALAEALDSDPTRCAAVFDALRSISTEMLVRESRVYGGGLYKLEPKELAKVSAAPVLPVVEGLNLHRQMQLFP